MGKTVNQIPSRSSNRFIPDHPIDSTTLPITLQIWPATADPHVPALDPRAALAPQRIALAMPAVNNCLGTLGNLSLPEGKTSIGRQFEGRNIQSIARRVR